jgi:cell fate regulator YaaT (PSP1 superfamily)
MDQKHVLLHANDRVDFRINQDFAKEFSTRVEMKQVGFRQEAARLGRNGSCGRIMLFYLVN